MKKTRFLFSVLFLNAFLCLFVLACKNNSAPDESPSPEVPEISDEEFIAEFIEGYELSEARVVRTKKTSTMNAYTIIYPSKDPYGDDVMLSAVISVSPAITADNPAKGLVLYNHATINKATECPSRSDLGEQKMIAAFFPVITISPDYYGFGCTEKEHQAYCIGAANARASVDALIAAKKLLPELGYSDYGTKLFNMGYSQGGQTTMAVLKLVTQKYPEIKFTRTFAGAGPYDLEVFYEKFLDSSNEYVSMPSAVIDVLYAYNKYGDLNISLDELFTDKIIEEFDEWFESKKYSSGEIGAHLNGLKKTDIFADDVLDKDSEVSKKLMDEFKKDSILHDWTPATDESIYLYHHTNDETVPVGTTEALKVFLNNNGLSDSEVESQGLKVVYDNTTEAINYSFHAAGITPFFREVLLQASALLQ